MFKPLIRAALPLGAALLVLLPQVAAARDAAVERRLTQAGYTFKADKDGDYVVVIKYAAENRSQAVFVSGRTVMVNGIATRRIFSGAAVESRSPITPAMALALVRANHGHGMGAWELSGGVLYLSIKVPDSISAVELRAVIRAAAELADNKEEEITGARDEL